MTKSLIYRNPGSDVLDVILPGASPGIEGQFIKKIFDVCKQQNHSVIAFNFPFYERGEEHSSGPKLKEELNALGYFLKYADYKKYKTVRLIGKSLGGIVVRHYLKSLPQAEKGRYEVFILGYIPGEEDLKDFNGKIVIIQGEKDRFGSILEVKKEFEGAKSRNISYFEVAGADHSYRDPDTKEPKFENEVITILRGA